jgi:GSH-dependent disulfide-bond oxidoreductase
MIYLYYWPTPNGRKITIFLEEARLDYKIIPVDIGRGDQFDPEFLKISPNNRMPAIVDPEGPGGKPFSLFESGAILIYLAEEDREILVTFAGRALRSSPMADVPNVRRRANVRTTMAFSPRSH